MSATATASESVPPVTVRDETDAVDPSPEVVTIDPGEVTEDDATELVVAGGDREVVARDDLIPPREPTRFVPPPIEALADDERVRSLESEVARLRRVAASLDERVVELVERVRHEERRGDTWQELALRGEDRVRECTLELERYRGFAHSPWWVRVRGL